jgi:peptidoglycan hydrolase CwlO-like protein
MILIPILVFGQGEAVKRARLEAQIAEIEREIASLDGDLDEVQEKKKTLENEVYRLNTEIKRTELTIKGLNLSISRAGDQITLREINIDEAQSDMEKRHSSLAEYIRMLHKYTDRSLVEILLSKDLTTFFREIDVLEGLQENAQVSLGQLKVLKNTLEKEQTILQREREDFYSLRALENNQKQTLAGQRSEKDGLLKVTKGEEAVYQNLISNKKRDIAAIRSQIFYLEQTGITAEDAVKYAELAAQRAGIRPAFLLGLLEVETGRRFAAGVITAGSNLGSGNWQDDMVKCYERLGTIYYPDRKLHFFNRARTEEKAFLEITSKLGFDPNSVKVSAEPSYGCGGAMGPAQFIPSTWLLFENRVAKLTGRSPANPWVVEDAFTAAALYLADAGATSKSYSGENGAARAYIGGSRTCSSGTCVWYSKEVLRVAALIDKNL